MLVGVPKEIKNHEYRVGLTPESVAELVGQGHSVIVETNAGTPAVVDEWTISEPIPVDALMK